MAQVPVQKFSESSERNRPIFEEFDRIADRIRMQTYNLFSHRGAGDGHALDDWLAAEREFCWPAAELTEQENQFSLKMALAGFAPREITVTATPREIMIKAAHQQKASGEKKGAKLQWSEFRSNDVFRRIELPARVDVEKISASLKNGLLEITARKAEVGEDRSKEIELSD